MALKHDLISGFFTLCVFGVDVVHGIEGTQSSLKTM